jgi:cytochrome P450
MSKIEYDPYSHAVHDDPYVHYAQLREHEPVYFNEQHKFWLLTKWDHCYAVFRDFKSFSSKEGPALEANANQGEGSLYPMFIASDPPRHTHLRRVVSQHFTPAYIARLEDYIRNKAIALLTPHLATGTMDMVQDFSALLPMAVIATMIHVPAADQDKVRGWADDLIHREDGQSETSERQVMGYLNLGTYFDNMATERAKLPHDPDDLFSCILQAEKDGKMAHSDVVGFGILLAVAGNETTTKLIGNAVYRLWQYPEQRQLLIDNPSKIPDAIEEILRFDGSSQIIGRLCVKDTVIGGKTIKAGDRVGLAIISASRDEDHFPNANTFDVTRGERAHMAFGFGIHGCLGSALARLEIRVCLEEILRLTPHYEIDVDGLARTYNPNVRGYTHIPVSFKAEEGRKAIGE